MKFSIVITTYNRLALLKRAIHSALTQTFPCEVIIADDGSNDGTEEYVCQLSKFVTKQGNYQLIYHRNATNSGHSATMNAGVKMATGDWIKPIDDDDYLSPGCIATMNQAIAIHNSNIASQTQTPAVICSCQAAQVDPDGKELSRTRIVGPGTVFYIPQEDIHYGMLLEQVPFGTPVQVAYRRDAFLRSGGWDSNLDANCDDIDSWIKIAQFGDGIFINQCLAYRTIWPGAYNQTFSLKKRLETNILMKEKIYRLVHQKHHKKLPEINNIRGYLKLHWGLVALKKAQFSKAAELSSSAVFSSSAWKILMTSIASRQLQKFPDAYTTNLPNSTLIYSQSIAQSHILDARANLKLQYSRTALQEGKLNSGLKSGLTGMALLLSQKVLPFESRLQVADKTAYPESAQILIQSLETDNSFLDYQSKLNINYVKELRSYLKIRCAMAAAKQGKVKYALQCAFPSIFSIAAWKYFISLVILQKQKDALLIQKLVLVDADSAEKIGETKLFREGERQ
ncbi:MAG: glycosyltransferase family 2 protein [Microcoleaceae cyanobacterium]